MSEVYFYHLTASPVEVTLPMLLGKAREAGWRVCVRGRDAALLDLLDAKLWGEGDRFLAHGRAGGEFDAEQPILLTESLEIANAAECLVSVGGADLHSDEVASSRRAMILFDGTDGEAVQIARGQWTALTDAGAPAKYWAQDGGKWVMKSQHPKPSDGPSA